MCLTHQSYFSGVFCPPHVFMATRSLFLPFVPHQSSHPMAHDRFKEDASPPSPFFPLVEVGEASNKESDLDNSFERQAVAWNSEHPIYKPICLIGISHIPTPPPPPLFPRRSPFSLRSLRSLHIPLDLSPPSYDLYSILHFLPSFFLQFFLMILCDLICCACRSQDGSIRTKSRGLWAKPIVKAAAAGEYLMADTMPMPMPVDTTVSPPGFNP